MPESAGISMLVPHPHNTVNVSILSPMRLSTGVLTGSSRITGRDFRHARQSASIPRAE